ncbi:hypothetical protein [Texcoconibacillus texcoconensis]|uniref:Spore coat protein n=1 Tax=Texcoconibacillus texcoconensis TaxID=1095777 RepID=A0A840QQ64_9BACI|nr:hypothetical protein [Texcoconibacillus texcoconensis]MBB5173505.1 hypothetical protein [Texcoconibacillus texcoconensis]
MQQQTQGNQQISPQPPNVVTEKDHQYLTDMLAWNLLAMKKARMFASQCQDQEVAQAIDRVGNMHYQHYHQLLQHLNQNQQPGVGQQQQQQQPIQ